MRYQQVMQTHIVERTLEQLVKLENTFMPASGASKKTKRLIAKLRRSKQVTDYTETVKFTIFDTVAITSDLLSIPGVLDAINGVFRYTDRAPQAVLVGDDVFCKLIDSPGAQRHFDMSEIRGPVSIRLDRIDLLVNGHVVKFSGINMVVVPWMKGWVVL